MALPYNTPGVISNYVAPTKAEVAKANAVAAKIRSDLAAKKEATAATTGGLPTVEVGVQLPKDLMGGVGATTLGGLSTNTLGTQLSAGLTGGVNTASNVSNVSAADEDAARLALPAQFQNMSAADLAAADTEIKRDENVQKAAVSGGLPSTEDEDAARLALPAQFKA